MEQIVEMTTINSARALKADDMIGTLKPGMDADISILEVISGKWKFEDYEKETLEINKLIVPRVTIKSGQLIKC